METSLYSIMALLHLAMTLVFAVDINVSSEIWNQSTESIYLPTPASTSASQSSIAASMDSQSIYASTEIPVVTTSTNSLVTPSAISPSNPLQASLESSTSELISLVLPSQESPDSSLTPGKSQVSVTQSVLLGSSPVSVSSPPSSHNEQELLSSSSSDAMMTSVILPSSSEGQVSPATSMVHSTPSLIIISSANPTSTEKQHEALSSQSQMSNQDIQPTSTLEILNEETSIINLSSLDIQPSISNGVMELTSNVYIEPFSSDVQASETPSSHTSVLYLDSQMSDSLSSYSLDTNILETEAYHSSSSTSAGDEALVTPIDNSFSPTVSSTNLLVKITPSLPSNDYSITPYPSSIPERIHETSSIEPAINPTKTVGYPSTWYQTYPPSTMHIQSTYEPAEATQVVTDLAKTQTTFSESDYISTPILETMIESISPLNSISQSPLDDKTSPIPSGTNILNFGVESLTTVMLSEALDNSNTMIIVPASTQQNEYVASTSSYVEISTEKSDIHTTTSLSDSVNGSVITIPTNSSPTLSPADKPGVTHTEVFLFNATEESALERTEIQRVETTTEHDGTVFTEPMTTFIKDLNESPTTSESLVHGLTTESATINKEITNQEELMTPKNILELTSDIAIFEDITTSSTAETFKAGLSVTGNDLTTLDKEPDDFITKPGLIVESSSTESVVITNSVLVQGDNTTVLDSNVFETSADDVIRVTLSTAPPTVLNNKTIEEEQSSEESTVVFTYTTDVITHVAVGDEEIFDNIVGSTEDSELGYVERGIIIGTALVAFIAMIIIIVLCYEGYRKKRYSRSFDVHGSSSFRVKFEDFSLTKLERPGSTYSGDGPVLQPVSSDEPGSKLTAESNSAQNHMSEMGRNMDAIVDQAVFEEINEMNPLVYKQPNANKLIGYDNPVFTDDQVNQKRNEDYPDCISIPSVDSGVPSDQGKATGSSPRGMTVTDGTNESQDLAKNNDYELPKSNPENHDYQSLDNLLPSPSQLSNPVKVKKRAPEPPGLNLTTPKPSLSPALSP